MYPPFFFAKHFTIEPTRLIESILVATLMGKAVVFKYTYRECKVSVCGKDTLACLMLLDMVDFDVILKMDWLASFHATMDCHDITVKFTTLRESSFSFQGDQSEIPNKLISILGARRLLWKGCQGYLVL